MITLGPNETHLATSQPNEETQPNEQFDADLGKQLSELEQLIEIESASQESEEEKEPINFNNTSPRGVSETHNRKRPPERSLGVGLPRKKTFPTLECSVERAPMANYNAHH